MNAPHGLAEATISKINGVLDSFPTVGKAILFGSRAKGTHTLGSDIDLALVGENLDWREAGRISSAFDDLSIPYSFSVVVLNERTDPDVAAHIRRVGIRFFERAAAATR